MITYRMDLTNFVQGARSNVRIATGAGLKTDFTEFSSDANTLGLWHLHDGGCQGEGTGLADASGGGHTLTNNGASPQEDGYRFVRAESDYMQASFPGQPERSQVTLEMWVRGWAVPVDSLAFFAVFEDATLSNFGLFIWAYRAADPSASFLEAYQWSYAEQRTATWMGTAVDALLAAAEPWHVAAVLNTSSLLRMYVNGLQRAASSETSPALPAGDYDLYLGTFPEAPGLEMDAVLDEVRLSSSARYATTFPVPRLVAAGTYTGLTFDSSGRPGAVWVGLPSDHLLPPGTALTWEVRAADATDGAGEPQAPWQPYDGDPSSLPRGRYFQWRATLASSPNRLVSPTVQSVEAQAGEMGYDIFHAVGDAPESLDYAAPWARVGPGVVQLVTAPLDLGAVHWFGVRPVDDREIACPTTQSEARLELDEQGSRVAARPAGALAVSARPLPAACVRLSWSYRAGSSGAVPQVFRIFGDGGTGQINYSTPLGEVPYRESQPAYAWTSGPLATGVQHQLAVRAIAAGDTWDEQPAVAFVTPDAAPPGQVDGLEAEVIL
jgi:hypothetical protein